MKCNFASPVQHVTYANLHEVLSDMRDIIDMLDDSGGIVTIVCRNGDVGDIVREFSDYDWVFVQIDDTSYTNEYLVQINTDFSLYCEECIRPDGGIHRIETSDITFVCEDCDSEILDRIDGSVVVYSIE